MTLFDRYLLSNYLITFCILFCSVFGLFVVGDLFDNIDDFFSGDPAAGFVEIVKPILSYYGYQSFFFLNRIGSILIVLALLILLIIVLRRGEFVPPLAAGVPIHRLILPFIIGAVVMDLALVANRELLIPKISHHKHENRGKQTQTQHSVEPVYDHSSGLLIRGRRLTLGDQTLWEPEFVLPSSLLVEDLTIIRAEKAVFMRKKSDQKTGWLLKGVQNKVQNLRLTPAGEQIVLRLPAEKELFIETTVGANALYKKGGIPQLQSTPSLIEVVRDPSISSTRTRHYVAELHCRILQPFVNLTNVLIVCVCLVYHDMGNLITNVGRCLGTVGLVLGVQQLFSFMGTSSLVDPALVAWIPVLLGGVLLTWTVSADRI